MKKFKHVLFVIAAAFISFSVSAEDMNAMMRQYMQMGEGAAANFPNDLDFLMPASFKPAAKNFVFEETAKMFLVIGMTGTKENRTFPKFGQETTIQIGIMGYAPSASYMQAQMPVVMAESKKGLSAGRAENGGGMKYDPVTVVNAAGTEIYVQHYTVEVNEEGTATVKRDYYNADAVVLKKNVMLQLTILSYPQKKDEIVNVMSEVIKKFSSVNFDKYMK